jgi:hypothetical protein
MRAPDERQASASARSAPASLLHLWEGSSGTGAIEFHATEERRRCLAVAPGAFAAWPERQSPGGSNGAWRDGRRTQAALAVVSRF